MRWMLFVCSLGIAAPASAQSADGLREVARRRGWTTTTASTEHTTEERWCAAPPCPAATDASVGDVIAVVTHGPTAGVLFARAMTATGWVVRASIDPSVGTFSFRFARGEDVIDVAWEHRFDVPDGLIAITGEDAVGRDLRAWLGDEVAAYLASSASFQERALRRSAELRARVRAAAPSMAVCPAPDDPGRYVCAPGPGGSHGMFDRCVRRRLTDPERTELLTRLDTTLDRRDALIHRHAAEWHRTLAPLLAGVP